jgi:23S rRNA (cytosine1962-C5)-methyltransferase
MFSPDQYALLDFGAGRKLERFGPVVLDRPSPAAADVRRADDSLWNHAASRFVATMSAQAGCGQAGQWLSDRQLPSTWTIRHPPFAFELRATPMGHVGVFPEQTANWDWIAEQVTRLALSGQIKSTAGDRPRVLNLFAYTGGSTLAAAAAGAEVVHIDASRSTVAWARRNAALSGLQTAPIRWIVEDARRFVLRENKRGNRYHGVILDPPTYGHGPNAEQWQLERDLPDLLSACPAILDLRTSFVVLSCHAPGMPADTLGSLFRDALDHRLPGRAVACDLCLTTSGGRSLHSGNVVRWRSEAMTNRNA